MLLGPSGLPMRPRIGVNRTTTFASHDNVSHWLRNQRCICQREAEAVSWDETTGDECDSIGAPSGVSSLMRPAPGKTSQVATARRESIDVIRFIRVSTQKIGTGYTNKMANFRGTGHRMGKRAKQSTKQAKAAKLHAPKTSSRSHRLTNVQMGVSAES